MIIQRSPLETPPLSLARLIAFTAPNLGIGVLMMTLSVYLPRYYAGQIGLGLPAVGLAIMAVRLTDTFLDPLIGVAMDRTRTRFGRYRPWLTAGTPVLMFAVYMLFQPSAGASASYLIGWLFIFYAGVSFILLAQFSWASVLASDYNQRSRVFGALQITGVVGATAAIVIPILLAKTNASGSHGEVGALGWFGLSTLGVGVLFALSWVPERITTSAEGTKPSLTSYWNIVSRPDLRRIIVADFCLEFGTNWMSALYLFYFIDALGFSISKASALLLVYIGAGIAGAAAATYAATKFGKHRVLMAASGGYSTGLIGLAYLPRADMVLGSVFMFAMGFLASAFPLLGRAMIADVADAVRLEKEQNRVGLLYAMITTDQKLARAFSIGLSFNFLGLIGYQARTGALNSRVAIQAMEFVYLAGPAAFVLLGGACYIGYKLDASRHAEIRAALVSRDAQYSRLSADPTTIEAPRDIVERA